MLLLASLLLSLSAFGHSIQRSQIREFDLSGELINTAISHIYQDRAGYLWLATMNALHRYDGYTMQHWQAQAKGEHSLPLSWASQLLEDHQQRLWIVTEQGIAWLNPDRSVLQRVPVAITDRTGHRLLLDDKQQLWLGLRDGVYRFDEETLSFQPVFQAQAAQPVAEFGSQLILERDRAGRIWYGNGRHLILLVQQAAGWTAQRQLELPEPGGFDGGAALTEDDALCFTRAGQLHCVSATGEPTTVLRSSHRRCGMLRSDTQHRLYTICDGVLYAQRTSQANLTAVAFAGASDDNSAIAHIALDDADVLWIARRNEVLLWDTRAESVALTRLTMPLYDNNPAQVSQRWSLHRDRQGGMWISRHLGGLLRVQLTPSPFSHWRVPNHSETQIASQMIRAIYEDPRAPTTTLWLATYEPILWRLTADQRGDVIDATAYPLQRDGMAMDWHREGHAFIRDRHGQLWYGSRGGVWRFLESEQRFASVTLDWAASEPPAKVPLVMGFFHDSQQALWMYGNFGLARLKTDTGHAVVAERRALPSELGLTEAELLADTLFQRPWFGSDGYWWFPGRAGILRHHPASKQWQRWTPDNSALPCPWVHAVWEQPQGRFWLGSRGCGIQRIDWQPVPDAAANYQWHPEQSLPDNTIYGMAADQEQTLWLSSNRGIMRLDQDGKLLAHFTRSDGLQHNEFNNGQALRGQHGILYFGGINGISRINPALLTVNPVAPTVHVTAAALSGGVAAPLSSDTLRLQPGQTTVTLFYTGLHFDAPERNQFRYRLLGMHDDWIAAGNQRSAHFAALAPGNYRFEVQAANRDGVWSDTAAHVQLQVMPPWWRSGWAYGSYLLALLLAGWLYKQWRDRREQQLQELINERTHELQSALTVREQLLAHVSHEFRTPLTLILTPLDELAAQLPDTAKPTLATIQHNANRLLQLVDQLLQSAALAQQLAADRHPMCLAAAVRRECLAFALQAKHRGITLQLSTAAAVPVQLSTMTVPTLLYNLIGNALKYCHAGDRIEVAVTIEQASAVLTIADTGPGIPMAWQTRVFQPFERIPERTAEGSGLGLYLVQELLRLEHGQLQLTSAEGQGCRFRMSFPLATHEIAPLADPGVAADAIYASAESDAQMPTESSTRSAPVEPKAADPALAPAAMRDARQLVLIVEDHPELQQQLQALLQTEYHCLLAGTAEAALVLAKQELPDLILCDVGLPDESGFVLCERLKADRQTGHIPLFFLTAYVGQQHRLAGLQVHADDYLTKPYQPDELRLRIRNRLQARARLLQWWQQAAARGEWQTALAEIARQDPPLADAARDFVARLDTLLTKRYADREFGVEAMASALAKSPRTLQRHFQDYGLGCSPLEYLRRYRLQQAAALLRQGALVQDVVEACGLDPKRFASQFKAEFGQLPSAWREQHRAP